MNAPALDIRAVESSLAMQREFAFPPVYYIAEPENGAALHAAGDTPSEARANWIKRYAH